MAECLLEVIARVFGKKISSKLTVFILFLNTHEQKKCIISIQLSLKATPTTFSFGLAHNFFFLLG